MNLQHLVYFKALAKYQHMALTAERLDITQPTLSYAIRKLEDELGVPLFEKEGRNIKLSIYGSEFLKYVEKCLDALNEGKARLHDLSTGNSGTILLGVSSVISERLLSQMLASFHEIHENNDIGFQIVQAPTDHLLDQLESEKMDIALVSLTDAAKVGRKWQDLQISPLVSQRLVAIMPANLALANEEKVSLEQLAQYNMITFSHQSSLRRRIDRLWARKNIKPQTNLETDNIDIIISLVAQGQGVALIPQGLYQRQPHEGKIKTVPVADDVQYRVYLLTKSSALMSRIAGKFSRFAEKFCLDHPELFQ